MLNPIRTWYADDGDERAEVRADELRDINARVAQLEGQREATERMLFALRKEVAKLRNLQAKAWEPIALGKTIPCACKESVQGNCHVAIAPSNQYGERLEVIDGADVVSVILPDNIRLCRLVSQDA